MKLAVNLSMIFTEVPLIERFALAQEHGFSTVEIQFPYELSIQQIKEKLVQHHLTLCLINVPAGDLMQGGNGIAGIPGCEVSFSQALDLAIQYATALDVPRVNILAGKQPLDADLLPCLNTLSNNLKYACTELEQHHIQPVIEMINGTDMPRFLIQNIAQAQDILDAVDHPSLKLQYDCYHMAMMNENILETLTENIHNIAHIQFADCPDRHQPDTALMQYAEIFNYLNSSEYSGYIAAEYKPSPNSEASFAWKEKYFNS